jgi:DNA-3-methyladenine glycosylase I
MRTGMTSPPDGVRLDQWLWAARVYKTRGLAQAACRGGKVDVNGQAARPARPVRLGDRLRVTLGEWRRDLVVRGLDHRRGPAPRARELYEDLSPPRPPRAERAAPPARARAGPRPADEARAPAHRARPQGPAVSAARSQGSERRLRRCAWAGTDPLYRAYHDREWGVPVHDDRTLFEFLVLEGAQAGLSWLTILRKREHYRQAFAGFDPGRVARYGEDDVRRLLADPGIVRNRLKVRGAIRNARAFLEIQAEAGSFDHFVWAFVGGQPRVNAWRSVREVPARTAESDALSRALRARGFTFVGSTICYAFMQAVGLVSDHTRDCFRHPRTRRRSGA